MAKEEKVMLDLSLARSVEGKDNKKTRVFSKKTRVFSKKTRVRLESFTKKTRVRLESRLESFLKRLESFLKRLESFCCLFLLPISSQGKI